MSVIKPVDFSDTKNAFAYQTNESLKKAYWLFKSISYPKLVGIGSKLFSFGIEKGLPLKGIVRNTLYKQFVGGESIDKCENTIDRLWQYQVGTILDYSVEGMKTEKQFDDSVEEIIKTIIKGKNNPKIPLAVFKVTGIARFELLEKVNNNSTLTTQEEIEWAKVEERVNMICKIAKECGTPILIDAEESWIQDAIDNLANSMMEKYNDEKAIVYNTIQLYRHDRLTFMDKCLEDAKTKKYFLGFKLVRGAYMEKERERAIQKSYPSPIQLSKENSDKDFDLAVKFCIDNLESIYLVCGSHNEQSNLYLAQLMDEKQIDRKDKRIYFAQLLGMSDHISFNLSLAGFNVAKYVPYGPVEAVVPYLVRRAKENTSVAGQTSRELNLINQELKRRNSNG